MGLFSKIKSNLSHGGVKIDIQTPSKASFGEDIAVEINIESKEARQVNSISIKLEKELKDMNDTHHSSSDREIVSVELKEPMSVGPSRPIYKSVVLPLKIDSEQAEQSLQGQMPDAAAKVLGGIVTGVSKLGMLSTDMHKYRFYIRVVADVEGITFDPSKKQEIRMQSPSSFGGGINIGISS